MSAALAMPLAARAASAPSAPEPMLAKSFTRTMTEADFAQTFANPSLWAQELKHDGHRMLVVVAAGRVHAYSRAGNARKLPTPMTLLLQAFPDGVYDGELVAESGKCGDVVSHARVIVLFDVLRIGGLDYTGRTYDARRSALLTVLARLPEDQTWITTVVSQPPSWAAVQAIWASGGEGVVVKRRDSTYQPGKRSPYWIKVKQCDEVVVTITGFEAAKRGPYSKFCVVDADGHASTMGVSGNALLAAVTAAPGTFIGRRVVMAFQEKTESGAYRHGNFVRFAKESE
jgi:bifunctional non-homologous end joining protein LigD